MKIGVSTYSFLKWTKATNAGYSDICDKALELGFDGIEFTELKVNDPVEQAREIRAHCGKIGLPIIAYTVGANLLSDDPAAEAERLKRCVDTAQALGVSVMRHDVATKLRQTEGYTWESAVREMAPLIREISEYAEARGVHTCTENHGYLFQDSCRVEALIRAVGFPNYGWLLDMGNFLCVDENPMDAIRRAAPYAIHVHAKDFLYKLKKTDEPEPIGFFATRNGNLLRGTVVGHGTVPVAEAIGYLKKVGYNGWISLEFEGMEENIPALQAGLQYLRKVAE